MQSVHVLTNQSPAEMNDLIKMVGGLPLVLTFLEGTQGIGVILVETSKSARSVLEAFMGLKVNINRTYRRRKDHSSTRC